MSASVSPHDTFKLFVTHVETAENLLVVTGQRDRDAAIAIEQTIGRFSSAFSEGIGRVNINEVSVGQLYCAAYEDTAFCRALVIAIDADACNVTVQFIDYGYVHRVPISSIRTIRSSKLLTPLTDTPPLASNFLLSRFLANGTNPKLKETVRAHLKYKEVICFPDGSVRSPLLIKIMYMNRDYAEYLASQGAGNYVSLQQFEGQIRPMFSGASNAQPPPPQNSLWQRVMLTPAASTMNGSGPVASNPMPPPGMATMGLQRSLVNHMAPPQIQNGGHSIPQMAMPHRLAPSPPVLQGPPVQAAPTGQNFIRMRPPQQPQPGQFKSSVLEPGSRHQVFVSHVEDGPLAFSIQLVASHPQLITMMQDINSRIPEPITVPIHDGMMCLARFMEDMSLCRALVIYKFEDGATVRVYYVDYGNSDDVPISHIFAMPHDFAGPKILSFRFALNGVGATVSNEEKKIFKDLAQGMEATLLVCPPPENVRNKHLGELFLEGINVKDLMKEKLKKQPTVLRYPKIQLPPAGTKEEVIVSFVEESNSIFVQLTKHSDALNSLMDSVHNHCSGGTCQPLQQENKVPAMPCCAMYTDGSWYRAVILNCFGDDVVVMYVDYGNEEKVKFSELVNITPELVSQLRVQAIPCKLEGLEAKDVSKLKELEGQTLMMHVVNQKHAFVCIRLYDSEGSDVMGSPAKVTSPQSGGSSGIAPTQSQNFYDRGKGRPGDKTKMSSPGEDSGFNEDQNWRKANRAECNADKEESSGGFNDKPTRQFGDRGGFRSDREGDDRRGGFRSDRGGGDSRGGFRSDRGGDDSRGGFRSDRFGDKSRGDRDEKRGGFGGGDREENRSNDGDKPRSGFGDRQRGGGDREGGGRFGDREWRGGFGGGRDDGDKPRGGFRGRGDGEGDDRPRGGFGDRQRGGGDRDDGGGRFGGKGRFDDKNDGGGRFGGRSGGGSSYNNKSGGYGGAAVAAKEESWGDDAAAVTSAAFPFSDLEGTSIEVAFAFGEQSKFYLHKKPEDPDFTQLGETISSTYTDETPKVEASLVKTDLLCVAFSSEYAGWYRARVVNPIEGGAHVHFIDYGNSEDVYYDNLKAISDDLKKLPPQAIPCTLRGVPSKEWSETEITEFAALAEAELTATFVELNNEVFSTVLIDTATQETLNEKFGATPDSLKPLAATIRVPDMTLEYEVGTQAEIPWFINPAKFFIQFLSSKGDLVNLMQSIQDNFKNLKPLKTCEPGWFVLARFKEDKVVYRALVKKADDPNNIGVEFIDYGNCDLVEKGSVFLMAPEHAVLPRQAIRCKLDGVAPVGDAWPPAGTSDIDNSFMGEMTCTIVRVDEDGVAVVSLNRAGVNVAAELIEKDLATAGAPLSDVPSEIDMDLLPGQVLSGRVTYVNADEKQIFVVLEKSVADQLNERIAQSTASPDALTLLTADCNLVGEWCLVSTSADKCLRAEIVDPTCASGVLVKLVDVGIYEEVSPDKMYFLPDEVAMTPAQATEFKFDGDAEEGQEIVVKISSSDNGLSATLVQEDLCPLPILRKSAKVYVPFVNSTTVWVQLVSLEGCLAELLEKIFEAYNESAVDTFTPSAGALCAAYSIADETWYRARVAEISEEGITVFYVDYGNTEVLPKDNLRELSSDFKTHAFAREMQLPITSSDDLSDVITELTANAAFDADFATRDGLWQVDLKKPDGVKLSDAVIGLGKATRIENCFFPEEFTAYLAHLESLNEIYLHDDKEFADLEAFQAELQTLAETLEDVDQEVGSVCLALYEEDQSWYRAEILEDGRALFIDYGNADSVNKVKKLPEEKLQQKRFAKKCCLTAPEGRAWTPEDAERVTGLLSADGAIVTVKILEDGDLKVVEMSVSGRDLKTELVENVVSTDVEGAVTTEQIPTDNAGVAGEELAAEREELASEGEVLASEGEVLASEGEVLAAEGEALPGECLEKEGTNESEVAVEPEVPIDETTIDTHIPDVEENEISQSVRDTCSMQVNEEEPSQVEIAAVPEPAYGEEPSQLENAAVPESAYDEEPSQVENAAVPEPAYDEEPSQVENAAVREPAYDEEPSQVENAAVYEHAYDEEPSQVEDAAVSEHAYDEEPSQVENAVVHEAAYEEPSQLETAAVPEPAYYEEPFQLENAAVPEPAYYEEPSQVENAAVYEHAYDEEPSQVEDAAVSEHAYDEEPSQGENAAVCERSYEEPSQVENAVVPEAAYEEPSQLETADVPELSHEEEPFQLENAAVPEPAYHDEPFQLENAAVPEPAYKEPSQLETADVPEPSHEEEPSQVEYAAVPEPAFEEEPSQTKGVQVPESACEERTEAEDENVTDSSSEEQPIHAEHDQLSKPPYEEQSFSSENRKIADFADKGQLLRTGVSDKFTEKSLKDDFLKVCLPDTSTFLQAETQGLTKDKDYDGTVLASGSSLLKGEAMIASESNPKVASEEFITNDAGEPSEVPKDIQEAPLSQMERDVNSDDLIAKETSFPLDKVDAESENFETEPEETIRSIGTAIKREYDLSPIVVEPTQGEKLGSPTQVSDCGSLKEETNGPSSLGGSLESVNSTPRAEYDDPAQPSNSATKKGAIGHSSFADSRESVKSLSSKPGKGDAVYPNFVPKEQQPGVDDEIGVLKKTAGLLRLTDELIAETDEIMRASDPTSGQKDADCAEAAKP